MALPSISLIYYAGYSTTSSMLTAIQQSGDYTLAPKSYVDSKSVISAGTGITVSDRTVSVNLASGGAISNVSGLVVNVDEATIVRDGGVLKVPSGVLDSQAKIAVAKVIKQYTGTFESSSSNVPITHGLGTEYITVQVFELDENDNPTPVLIHYTVESANQIILRLPSTPMVDLRVVILGTYPEETP